MDRANNFLGRGVDGLEGLAINTLDPLVIDKPVGEGEELARDFVIVFEMNIWSG